LCKILDSEEVKPHKVRYYLEKRDPEFGKNGRGAVHISQSETAQEGRGAVEPEAERPIVSYDEKPGTSPATMNTNATAQVTLLTGIDLVTGKVHALVE
jgi:hypothetical protein